MTGLVYVGDALYPLDQIERAPAFWETGREGQVPVRVNGKSVMVCTFNGEFAGLLMRPTQLVPSEPGTRLLRVWVNVESNEDKVLKAPVVAWALCFDGEVRPVTAHGVNGGNTISEPVYVEMPDGSVQSTSIHDEVNGYDNVEAYRIGETERIVRDRADRAAREAQADRDTGL